MALYPILKRSPPNPLGLQQKAYYPAALEDKDAKPYIVWTIPEVSEGFQLGMLVALQPKVLTIYLDLQDAQSNGSPGRHYP